MPKFDNELVRSIEEKEPVVESSLETLEGKLVFSVVEQSGMTLSAEEVREVLDAVHVKMRVAEAISHFDGAIKSYIYLRAVAIETGNSEAEDSYDFLITDVTGKRRMMERMYGGA